MASQSDTRLASTVRESAIEHIFILTYVAIFSRADTPHVRALELFPLFAKP